MTVIDTEAVGTDETGRQQGTFTRCSRCTMEVRRTELEVHLAHAHNIGPVKERKDKDGRRSRDRSERSERSNDR